VRDEPRDVRIVLDDQNAWGHRVNSNGE
jgi:hypothetical protein